MNPNSQNQSIEIDSPSIPSLPKSIPPSDQTQNAKVSPVTVLKNGDVLIRTVGAYQIRLLRPKCIAAASCIAISPDLFELDEQSLVKFVAHENPDLENVLLAAQSCPTAAIVIVDVATGTQLWPSQE